MKLSEAIRVGSKMRPQAFGSFYVKMPGEPKSGCVLGAAADGSGNSNLDILLHELWPVIKHKVSCPACEQPISIIHKVMIHLNDGHRWTREAIADWIEPFEENAKPQTITVEKEIQWT